MSINAFTKVSYLFFEISVFNLVRKISYEQLKVSKESWGNLISSVLISTFVSSVIMNPIEILRVNNLFD